ncbi:MAG: GNAT family N-acetyltransferase [Microbacterium sp. 14-71-5]|nr:MAG: GNAT family N-acetyltransferase [Microbacterium sp. 14-71-5]
MYEFSADPARLDRARVHDLLVSHAYWAAGRSRAIQDSAIDASRNYGVYHASSQRQVAYARVVTDGVTFGWLADVVVEPEHRGRGLGRLLVSGILTDLEPLGLKRVLLKASPAGRALYAALGWTSVDDPDDWMELRAPRH